MCLSLISKTAMSINVTATISYSDVIRLNGTWIDCDGARVNIGVQLLSKYNYCIIITTVFMIFYMTVCL